MTTWTMTTQKGELMSDLISRQAVKEWLAKWEGYIDSDIIARMQYRIIDMPSAQPEPHWIPVSERLPENEDYDETFTVTIQCEHVDGWDDYVTGYADWTPHGWDIQSYYLGQIKVTAWMPLPEPYQAERRTDEKENV